jgi:hypothetical protein
MGAERLGADSETKTAPNPLLLQNFLEIIVLIFGVDRDRIYALLGVSPHYRDVEIPITYKIPVVDFYKNLTKYVIAGSRKLDILTYAGQDGRLKPTGPSWERDWQ